jgi:hypothetical protein
LSVAAGGAPMVSVTGAVPTVMVTGAVFVFAGEAESVAVTLTLELPAAVGVPVTVQFPPSVRPAGSVPEAREQV